MRQKIVISDELADLTEDLIYKAEFYSGSGEEQKFDNSVLTANIIEEYANKRVIEELKRLLKYEIRVYGSMVITSSELESRIEELKQKQ